MDNRLQCRLLHLSNDSPGKLSVVKKDSRTRNSDWRIGVVRWQGFNPILALVEVAESGGIASCCSEQRQKKVPGKQGRGIHFGEHSAPRSSCGHAKAESPAERF